MSLERQQRLIGLQIREKKMRFKVNKRVTIDINFIVRHNFIFRYITLNGSHSRYRCDFCNIRSLPQETYRISSAEIKNNTFLSLALQLHVEKCTGHFMTTLRAQARLGTTNLACNILIYMSKHFFLLFEQT